MGNLGKEELEGLAQAKIIKKSVILFWLLNPLSAGDAFKRIHTVFPQLKFDRN